MEKTKVVYYYKMTTETLGTDWCVNAESKSSHIGKVDLNNISRIMLIILCLEWVFECIKPRYLDW